MPARAEALLDSDPPPLPGRPEPAPGGDTGDAGDGHDGGPAQRGEGAPIELPPPLPRKATTTPVVTGN